MTEEMGLILGRIPQSKNEWYVAQALIKYEIDFRYQIPIDGGTRVRGGQVLDFLVYNPFRTAVPVQGEYYHESDMDDVENLKLQQLADIYGSKSVIPLWGRETDTLERAEKAVQEKLM